jgi:thiol-disulfide isomerase/thioredoxin
MLNKKFIWAILTVAFTLTGTAMAQSSLPLKSLSGSSVDVQAQRGKVVVLAIGAAWLPLSKDQAVITNKLVKKYAGKDVVIYWVSNDSDNAKSKNYATDEQVKAFADKNKLTVSVLRDPAGLSLKKFNIDQIPAFVILDKTGKQAGEAFGGLDPETDITPDIAAKIDTLLK